MAPEGCALSLCVATILKFGFTCLKMAQEGCALSLCVATIPKFGFICLNTAPEECVWCSCLQQRSCLSRDDDRKSEGITMFAFKHGEPLCFDCVCVILSQPHNINETATRVSSAANAAETVEQSRYWSLSYRYQFEAVVIETEQRT